MIHPRLYRPRNSREIENANNEGLIPYELLPLERARGHWKASNKVTRGFIPSSREAPCFESRLLKSNECKNDTINSISTTFRGMFDEYTGRTTIEKENN